MARHRITTAEYSALRAEAKSNATLQQVVEDNVKAKDAAAAKRPTLGNEEFLARAKRIESAHNAARTQVEAVAADDEFTYDDLKVAELSELLKERDLPHSGTKDELIARLVEADAAQAEGTEQPEG